MATTDVVDPDWTLTDGRAVVTASEWSTALRCEWSTALR
jgi:hypothetical protein